MIIGAVVEELIYIRDRFKDDLTRHQDEAICEACNLMDRLPRMEEATTYEPIEDHGVDMPDIPRPGNRKGKG